MTLLIDTDIPEKTIYLQASDAIDRLEEEVNVYISLTLDDKVIRRTRNSLIKTYEFSYEIFWQTLYIFLHKVEWVNLLDIVPIQVFREAERTAKISSEEFYALIETSADRDLIHQAHIETIAIEIADRIPAHYRVMKKILDKIKI